MKKILITQRVDMIEDRKEERESLDIRLINLIREINMLPIQISPTAAKHCKDIENYINIFKPNGIILSGGNNLGEYAIRDNFEKEILQSSKKNNIPIFGICRGFQILNSFCNGSLIKIENHCDTRHKLKGEKGFNNREVNSYHNYGVTLKTIGNDLMPLAITEDGCIEAIKHTKYPWLAIMWHPERESIFNFEDLKIIQHHFE